MRLGCGTYRNSELPYCSAATAGRSAAAGESGPARGITDALRQELKSCRAATRKRLQNAAKIWRVRCAQCKQAGTAVLTRTRMRTHTRTWQGPAKPHPQVLPVLERVAAQAGAAEVRLAHSQPQSTAWTRDTGQETAPQGRLQLMIRRQAGKGVGGVGGHARGSPQVISG